MMKNFDEMSAASKEMIDSGMNSFATVSNSMQTLAAESTEYSKKSFEMGTSFMEKMMSVKSVDKAVELQGEFAKSAYEDLVAQTTKMNDMVADMAKEAYKPFETAISKAS